MKPFSVNITREELTVVSLFSATQDIRYYLNGVYVECGPNGGRLVATDGSALMVCKIDADQCSGYGSGILDADTVKAALGVFKTLGRTAAEMIALPFNFADDAGNVPHVSIGIESGQKVNARLIDGKFPDYAKAIPAKVDGTPAHYDPQYIAVFSKAAKARGERNGMAPIAYNGTGAALVCIGAPHKYVGVLMPWRATAPLTEAPSWAREGVGEEPKAEQPKALKVAA